MAEKSRWEKHTVQCPEEKREAHLLVEWRKTEDQEVLNSISCDHPKLLQFDNWDCGWSCWKKISSKRKESL